MSPERLAISALVFGIVLFPLQWLPPIPVPGMQICDPFFLLAGLATLASGFNVRALRPGALLASVVFLGSATVAAAIGGGDWLKLLGHGELVGIAILVGYWAAVSSEARLRIERGLVIAAIIAAGSAVLGVVLFYLGVETPLLNPHSGDLLAGNYPRVRGTMVRANMMASVVGTGLLVLVGRPRREHQDVSPAELLPWTRLRTPAILLLITALMFSFSRTVPFLLWAAAFPLVQRRGGWRWAAWLVTLICGLALVYIASRYKVLLDPTEPWNAAVTRGEGTRWVHASGTLNTALSNPWGIGPGHAPAAGWTAHFTWLNTWAVLGLPATVGLVALFLLGLARRRHIGSGAWLALLLLLTDTLHRDVEDMRHLWILLGLLAFAGSGVGQEVLVSEAEPELEPA